MNVVKKDKILLDSMRGDKNIYRQKENNIN